MFRPSSILFLYCFLFAVKGSEPGQRRKLENIIRDSVTAGQDYVFTERFTVNYRTFASDEVATWPAQLPASLKDALASFESNLGTIDGKAAYKAAHLNMVKTILVSNADPEYRDYARKVTDVQDMELLFTDPEKYKIRFSRDGIPLRMYKKSATNPTTGDEIQAGDLTDSDKSWAMDYYATKALRDSPSGIPMNTMQSGKVTLPCGLTDDKATLTVTGRETSNHQHYTVNTGPTYLPLSFATYKANVLSYTKASCPCVTLKRKYKDTSCCAGLSTASSSN